MKKILLIILSFICVLQLTGQTSSSVNGLNFTPQGDLRILVVFVRFTNFLDYDDNDWHSSDTIPEWAQNTKFIFRNLSDFDTVSADNERLSNYFYCKTCLFDRLYITLQKIEVKHK